jgi:tetratricopeptide (TPR) repeat protein
MTMSEGQGLCRQVDENMCDIIDGVANNALFDHMAGCERCRDARYDAEQVSLIVGDAGADYHFPEQLAEKLLARLDARSAPTQMSERMRSAGDAIARRLSRAPGARASESPSARPSTPPSARPSTPPSARPSTPPSARPSARPSGPSAARTSIRPAARKLAEASTSLLAERASRLSAMLAARGPAASLRVKRTLRNAPWAWLSLAAAIGLGTFLMINGRHPGQQDTGLGSSPPDPDAPVAAWQAQVVSVESAFGSTSGLVQCARGTQVCQPLAPGDVALPGMRLETDGLTRALVKFADGSALALDRLSRFEIDANEARRGRLLSGNLVAEVAHLEEAVAGGGAPAAARAIIDVPLGRAEVLGTKFSLRADDGESRVEVSRGSVKLVGAHDQSILVHPGEAAVLATSEAPRLERVLDLSQAFGWSSSAFEDRPKSLETGALGELVAKGPADARERTGAVQLTQHDVKVRIVDNLARTEISEVFENRTDEVLEGIYRFPLPPGAQIERLALEVDGKLEEGAFVDREKAAAIWRGAVVNAGGKKPAPNEEIIWVPGPWRDPALLEWQRGGRFELRVFPIPKRGSRRIVLAYTEVLPPSEAERTYVYPLPRDPRGSTRIGRFTLEVQVRGHDTAHGVRARGYALKPISGSPEVARLAFDENDFVPRGDLEVAYELARPDAELRTWAYQPNPEAPTSDRPSGPVDREPELPSDAPYVAMALKPSLPRRARDEARDYVLIADTSRSMIGESYRRAIEVVQHIIREMDRSDRVTVLGCDSTCQGLPGGYAAPGDAAADAAKRFLDGIEPEGASDLAAAVEQAAALRDGQLGRSAGDAPERSLRLIYIGDGTPTVGPIHPSLLERAIVEALPPRASLFAVAIGNDADRGALRVATRAGGGISVPFSPGQSALDVAYAVLGGSYGYSLQNARLELPEGLLQVLPKKLGSVAAGAEAIVVARMTRPRVEGSIVLRGEIAGEPFEQRYPVQAVASPGEGNAFVPRLYASVAIDELESSLDESARKKSIELSTRFNVASRYTSLLVMESPAMFSAFGLDNRRSAPEWSGEYETQKAESASDPEELSFSVEESAMESLGRARAASSGAGNAARSAEAAASAASPSTPASAQAEAELDRSDAYAREPKKSPDAPGSTAPSPNDALGQPEPRAGDDGLDLERPDRPLELMPRPRRMIPMRRVWARVGRIDAPPSLLAAAAPARREALELRVQENAESRDALRNLYIAEFLEGDLDAAARSAERWSSKDPLDVDALTARADLAAQRGDRQRAIRILGSVVDVHPGDYKAQWRLARMYRWAGRPEQGCRHSLAVAQLMLRDAKLVTEAIGCARDVGQNGTADELFAALEPGVKKEVEQLARRWRKADDLSGDFRVMASWEGSAHDVDVVILDPEGHRVSWLGAPTRAVISANEVLSVHREGLALGGAPTGQYAVELVRSSASEGQIRGSVVLQVSDAKRSVPFVLEGERARVATVTLRNEARLVPLDGQ